MKRNTVPRSKILILFVVLLTAMVSAVSAETVGESSCYADCADGLAPTVDRGPAAGEEAPRFSAVRFDPESGAAESRTLDDLLAGRPLILAFGSYT